jgi:DNA-binding winged helix-turn-helix (wHTH) protein
VRPKPRLLTFGVFELDAATGELRKEGRLIHLRHQPVLVLRLLLERASDLVTRREITEALWPDDLDVDVEQGLNHCMKEIRTALGDRPDSPRYIQTLPRRGYRFLAEVASSRDTPSAPLDEADGSPPLPTLPGPLKASPSDGEGEVWLCDGRFE